MEHYLGQFQALADPTRFRLARVVDRTPGEVCNCELVDVLQLPQYAVSRAATALRRAGIINEKKDGKFVYYSINREPFVERIMSVIRAIPADDDLFRHDFDRLRWRLEIRSGDRCVVTYPRKEGEVDRNERLRVLFVCVHNSARSQIAEEYLRRYAGDLFEVESAGLTPGTLNSYVIDALAEEGIDISHKKPQSVVDLYRAGRTYAYVITVCSREAENDCPMFPGPVMRLNWPFPDPSRFTGSPEEISVKVRELRNVIRAEVEQFVDTYRERHPTAVS